MPQFIIECSEGTLCQRSSHEIMQVVYDAANSSGLFAENDIKVRIHPFTHYKLPGGQNDFLHVFGYMMEGRSAEQKAALSKNIIRKLNELLPSLSTLSMNVSEFEKSSYSNKASLADKTLMNNRDKQPLLIEAGNDKNRRK